METTSKADRQGRGKDQAFDDLHNRLHACDHTLCCIDNNTRYRPAYDLVVTHNTELWAIVQRVWTFKNDQPQRRRHLELFSTEVRELRESLHALK
ncbi:MAG TPA: hypothetical protein DCQ94_04945 [Nitrospira sp.]|jgi:hypothetical protein|nr:hypothetical protein [Nitrospira sp.]